MESLPRASANSLSSRVQLFGILQKRPFGHVSNKWCKRFFIILDGFMLYYPENELREFQQRKCFNLHPKGIVPLGGCSIEVTSEPNHPFAIQIHGDDLGSHLVVSAESSYERDKWISKLREASRVTWKNAQFGDVMIQQLESQGLKMAAEKQDYMVRLHEEVAALQEEKVKTEELERIREELVKEKSLTDKLLNELKEEYDKIKFESEQAAGTLHDMAEERKQLSCHVSGVQTTIEDLEKVRLQTLSELQVQQINEEKEMFSKTKESLERKLIEIEEKTRQLQKDKLIAEARLKDNEAKATKLEEDKQMMHNYARELERSFKEMAEQKATTEAELKAEIVARRAAEQRLQEAENSLARLEKAVQGGKTAEGQLLMRECSVATKEDLMGDVRTLKKFFENVAFETTLDAQSTIMIKSSMNTRKALVRRSQTMRYGEAVRKSDLYADLAVLLRSSNDRDSNLNFRTPECNVSSC